MAFIKHSDEPTTPVLVDVGLLWLLEAAIPHGDVNWLGDEYDGDGLLEQVHDRLLFCNDNEQPEATILLTERHCKLISMAVGVNSQMGQDHTAGKRLLMKAFRAERTLRDGPDGPTTTKDFSPTKERVLEWLKEMPLDSPDPD